MATYTAPCVSFLSLFTVGYCYENLSRVSGAFVSQSSTFISASLAVDGNYAQHYPECANTGKNQAFAWVQVDLRTLYSLKSVKIYLRNENSWPPYRLRQFYLDVSNSSAQNSTQRFRCYTDKTTAPATPLPVIDIPCKETARYIIVETTYHAPEDTDSTGPVLEICEIEVIGCNIGHYGQFCSSCGGCENCNIESGCRCDSNHYGPNCSTECSVNCARQICNNVTGICTYGCKNGFYSQKCDRICSTTCPSACNRYSGECDGECPFGKYGSQCDKTCSIYCRSGCTKTSGLCNSGCINGRFGADCLRICSRGCISDCHQVDGSCVCKKGWQGQQCDECSQHRYGPQCDQECSPVCLNGTCFSNNGSCKEGCNINFHYGKVTKQSFENNSTSNVSSTALYLVTAVLFLSIVLNIFFIVRNFRETVYKRQNSKDVQKQQDPTQDLNITTYESVGDNAGYQELGQLSQPSHYDKLK